MSKYKLVKDDHPWINKPENMGDVGDLRDITDELNRLLRERDEARAKAASWIHEWRELREFCQNLNQDANDRMSERDMLRTALEQIANLCQLTCLSFEEQCFEATKIASSALAQLKEGAK